MRIFKILVTHSKSSIFRRENFPSVLCTQINGIISTAVCSILSFMNTIASHWLKRHSFMLNVVSQATPPCKLHSLILFRWLYDNALSARTWLDEGMLTGTSLTSIVDLS